MAAAALAAGGLGACGGSSGSGPSAADPAPASSASPHTSTIYGSTEAPVVADRRAQLPESGTPTASSDPPVPAGAFRRPVAQYRAYVGRQFRQMDRDVVTLTAALRRGDRRAAKLAWGAADADYLRVGAAYGSFGKLDVRIDGSPSGRPEGVRDPSFTGLHRIEYELWTGRDPRKIAAWSMRLRTDVTRLRAHIPHLQIAALDYATRAHEILEDAQRDLLSGARLPWSGEGVRATAAALDATVEVMGTLRPVLGARDDAVVNVDVGIAGLRKALDGVRRDHGGNWPATAQLSRDERARLDGTLGAALESLSVVPDAAITTALPTIPSIAAQRASAAAARRKDAQ